MMSMSVLSADALENEIDRGQVGDQKIEIQIQGLFHYLCCNEHFSLPILAFRVLSKMLKDHALKIHPVAHGKTGVKQKHIVLIQFFLRAEDVFQPLKSLQCIIHRISYPAGTSSGS